MAHRVDPSTDVLTLLDNLKRLAEKPKHFGPIAFGYNPDAFVMGIEKIKASLPKDVKDASNINRDRERILEEAKAESDNMIEFAKREAQRTVEEANDHADRSQKQIELQKEQMLAESEILKIAKAQAEEIRNQAERDAAAMRRGADNYAHDTLCNLENVVSKILSQVERGKSEIDVSDLPARDRVRLS